MNLQRQSSTPWRVLVATCWVVVASCGGSQPPATPPAVRPSILLVTLDTTRADAIGPEATGVKTPAFNAVAARGIRFRQAYATVPETLPSHASMLTGLYPAGHGLHENARYLASTHPLVAEQLQQAGYRTAAFVSSFALARRFGLARGFDVYNDDEPAGQSERRADATTDAALAEIRRPSDKPLFLWVHYYDPHHPYAPPAGFTDQPGATPYHREVAFMDQQLGRLVEAFEQQSRNGAAILIAGDHGEGLGDHGEQQHGNLIFNSTMRVPLVIAGPGVGPAVTDTPASVRRIFHTILDWAGGSAEHSLRGGGREIVLGEGMKPFLEYGWQPQVMTVDGRFKAIQAGRLETYDIQQDPGELKNLGAGTSLPKDVREALDDYPVPSPEAARTPDALDEEAKRRLASLGYIGATTTPVVRKDAPRPADMTRLFDVMDRASGLFAAGNYRAAVPLLERILAEDRYNLDAALRLATAYSSLGRADRAEATFQKAAQIAPSSQDVRTYLALHYARGDDWPRAVPLLEQVFVESPDRLPVIEALASVRERQGRVAEAVALRRKAYATRTPTAKELVQLGRLSMEAADTPGAIEAFEKARALQGSAFKNDVELGVLYLAARRLQDARAALDRVSSSHPDYPMALFKRAQVSVLLDEPDKADRIAQARRHADATTRALIEREKLFR